jgi:hypothetical protein
MCHIRCAIKKILETASDWIAPGPTLDRTKQLLRILWLPITPSCNENDEDDAFYSLPGLGDGIG